MVVFVVSRNIKAPKTKKNCEFAKKTHAAHIDPNHTKNINIKIKIKKQRQLNKEGRNKHTQKKAKKNIWHINQK